MKASELRISNLILKNGKLHYTSYLTIRDIHGLSVDDTDTFEPIPTTEECLLKFGFEKLTGSNVIENCYNKNGYSVSFSKYGHISFWVSNDNNIIIKYVHQLQNLYFALTGEELTINH